MTQFFASGGQSISISPSNEYSGLTAFRMDWVGSPCSPRDSQESPATPQFKSINSSALSFLYRNWQKLCQMLSPQGHVDKLKN